jgi:hypothetical protein
MVEVEKPLDLLLVDTHSPCEFSLARIGRAKGVVQFGFGVVEKRRKSDQVASPRWPWYWKVKASGA